MKALLVGAGGMGRAWARNLTESPDADLVAWVDIQPGAAERAAAEHHLSLAYTGTDLAAAAEASGADFVVDVTIPEAHHDVTVQALGLGLPVIGEKPMAASMEQARSMVAASEKAGKLYMVSQSRRYDARINAYRELVQQLGTLGILNVDFYIGAHFGGFRDEMASPLVLDMAIHTFDQARLISDLDPVSVYAEEFNPSWSWYKGDVCATCLFEFQNGMRFTYRGSWCAEGLQTSWEGNWRAVGSNGTAIWEYDNTIKGEVVEETGSFHSKMRPISHELGSVPGGISGSLKEFLWALRTGKTPQGECHDNIKSLAMVFAAIESAKTGQRVPVRW